MLAYIIRRSLYGILIVFGVNIVLFALFFLVYSPDKIARQMLGGKNIQQDSIEKWKREHNYHYPLFFNTGFDKLANTENRVDVGVSYPLSVDGEDSTVALHGPYIKRDNVLPGKYRVKLNHIRGNFDGQLVVRISNDPLRPVDAVAEPIPFDGSKELKVNQAMTVDAGSLAFGDVWVKFDVAAPTPLVVSVASAKPNDLAAAEHASSRVAIEFYKYEELPLGQQFTRTIFWQRGVQLLVFDFGKSDKNNIPISYEIRKRMFPSLQIAVPMFLLALLVDVVVAMFIAFYRGTYLDVYGTIACVIGMSVSIILFIIAGQFIFGIWLKWFPISGFDFWAEVNLFGAKFQMAKLQYLLMPIIVGVIAGAGSAIRFYRTIFLEEIGRDYIRTARAKGLSETVVLFKHAMKNAMIPILTSVVMTLPFLFMGNLLLEYFFSIPGLGGFLIEAIRNTDFAVVRAMVYLGSVLYVVALILTDISYTLVDPRIRFS